MLLTIGDIAASRLSIGTYQSLLSTLITAQASVLAIVISVTLIAVQMVVTRYAPRMGQTPFQTKEFRLTFLVFGISILFDVIALFISDSVGGPWRLWILSLAVLLFALVGGTLIWAIQNITRLSTPEELVSRFTESLSADQYLKKAEEHKNAPGYNPHPLQPLYRLIHSAIENREYGTAAAGLAQYRDFLSSTLSEFESRGLLEQDQAQMKALFQPALKEHIRDIALDAAEEGERDIARSAIHTLRDMAEQGMRAGDAYEISGNAISGIRLTVLRGVRQSGSQILLNVVWPTLGELVEVAVETRHRSLLSLKNRTRYLLATTFQESESETVYRENFDDFFDSLCSAHRQTLQQLADSDDISLKKVSTDPWSERLDSEEWERLKHTTEMLLSSGSRFLEQRIDEGEYPATEGGYRDAWGDICEESAEVGATVHATELCQIVIEFAFIENVEGPFESPGFGPLQGSSIDSASHYYWSRTLSGIAAETETNVVERAFDEMLSYEPVEESKVVVIGGRHEETIEQNHQFRIDVEGYHTLNAESEYPELLENLREECLNQE